MFLQKQIRILFVPSPSLPTLFFFLPHPPLPPTHTPHPGDLSTLTNMKADLTHRIDEVLAGSAVHPDGCSRKCYTPVFPFPLCGVCKQSGAFSLAKRWTVWLFPPRFLASQAFHTVLLRNSLVLCLLQSIELCDSPPPPPKFLARRKTFQTSRHFPGFLCCAAYKQSNASSLCKLSSWWDAKLSEPPYIPQACHTVPLIKSQMLCLLQSPV